MTNADVKTAKRRRQIFCDHLYRKRGLLWRCLLCGLKRKRKPIEI